MSIVGFCSNTAKIYFLYNNSDDDSIRIVGFEELVEKAPKSVSDFAKLRNLLIDAQLCRFLSMYIDVSENVILKGNAQIMVCSLKGNDRNDMVVTT